jgi:hypothetical protein
MIGSDSASRAARSVSTSSPDTRETTSSRWNDGSRWIGIG